MSSSTAPFPFTEEKTVSLKTNDGRVFILPRKLIDVSFTIGDILRDLGVDEYTDFFEEIPLPDVSGPIFEKIVEWCLYHLDDPPYVHIDPREQRLDDIPQWDQDFLDVEQSVLFEIIMAVDNLDIKPLLNTCCKTVANLIKVELKEFEDGKDFQDTPVEETMTPATFRTTPRWRGN